jgi:PAS domain S-box-containing protein
MRDEKQDRTGADPPGTWGPGLTAARFRQLVDASPEVLWMVSPDASRVLYVNAAYEIVWGRPRAELRDNPRAWIEAIHPEDRELMQKRVQQMLRATDASTGRHESEYRILRPDGTLRWIAYFSFPILDDQGEFVALGGVATDITDWKRVEERDRRTTEDLRLLTETAMALVEFPCDGNLYTFIGEKTLQIIGGRSIVVVIELTEEETQFRTQCVLGPGDLVSEVREAMGRDPRSMTGAIGELPWKMLPKGRLVRYEGGMHDLVPRQMSAETARYLEQAMDLQGIWVIGFVRAGQTYGGVFILQRGEDPDPPVGLLEAFMGQATVALERRRYEDRLRESEIQLRQSQKMEAIGRLAGGMAHDLNNMLGTIIGYSEILLEDLRRGDPMRQDVEEIRQAAERSAALTEQLLTFSRKQAFNPQVLDPGAVLSGMDNMLRRLIGEDIELSISTRTGECRVRADRGQLEQVLMNLAVNARDAMTGGGRLTIEAVVVELEGKALDGLADVEAGPHVMLAVRDTGCGMDRDTRERIFEPFFTTKEISEGTGLGLSTVYGIVKQSAGAIRVISEPGQGSSFEVYLPCVNPAEAQPQPVELPASVARRGGSETVLVAEDEALLRNLIVRILELGGYAVLSARHGGEALLLCQQQDLSIDLLITDVVMPGMGGSELAQRLRPLQPRMKVLYTSGYTDGTLARHGVVEGQTPFIQKPFTPEALLNRVRLMLDG